MSSSGCHHATLAKSADAHVRRHSGGDDMSIGAWLTKPLAPHVSEVFGGDLGEAPSLRARPGHSVAIEGGV